MKKKVFLLLFLVVSSLVNSQQDNENLIKSFDTSAFEINIPNTWKKINPTYPYYWLNEYRYKDSTFNSYFNIGQYKIVNSKKNRLNKIVKHRVKELKKVPYRKFNYTINEKNTNHKF